MKNILQLLNGTGIKELSPKLWEAFVAIDKTLDELLAKINALTTPKTLYCRAQSVGTQTVPTGAVGINVAFTITHQNSNFHDNVNNNTNFYISEEGWYNVGCLVRWALNATGRRLALIYLIRNGAAPDLIAMNTDTPKDANSTVINEVATGIYLYPRDVLYLNVRQESGGDLNITTGESAYAIFWLQKNV